MHLTMPGGLVVQCGQIATIFFSLALCWKPGEHITAFSLPVCLPPKSGVLSTERRRGNIRRAVTIGHLRAPHPATPEVRGT